MRKTLFFALTITTLFANAQIYPFSEGFESYPASAELGTQGGFNSNMTVEAQHGVNLSQGLVAKMDVDRSEAFVELPVIGPLTDLSVFSFRYRVMQIGANPAVAGMLAAGDRIEVFAKSDFMPQFVSVLTIDQFNHQPNTAFKTISIPSGTGAGANVQFKIVVKRAAYNFFQVDMDELAVTDDSLSTGSIIIKPVITSTTCFNGTDGSISLLISGGIPPYKYFWSKELPGTANQPSVRAGSYLVTVIDSAGNTASAPLTVSQPQPIVLSTTPTHLACNGADHGSIDLSVFQGVAPYTYVWNTQNSTEDLAGLVAGLYTVTVSDFFNCTATVTQAITQPEALALTINTTPVSAPGNADGTLTVAVTGGTPVYTYSINGVDYVNDEAFTALGVGCYTVRVKDARNCMFIADEVCIEEQAITLSVAEYENSDVAVYPNPATNFIEVKSTEVIGYRISLINALGEVISSKVQTTSTERFDVSGLAQGNYFINVNKGNQSVRKTIMVVR